MFATSNQPIQPSIKIVPKKCSERPLAVLFAPKTTVTITDYKHKQSFNSLFGRFSGLILDGGPPFGIHLEQNNDTISRFQKPQNVSSSPVAPAALSHPIIFCPPIYRHAESHAILTELFFKKNKNKTDFWTRETNHKFSPITTKTTPPFTSIMSSTSIMLRWQRNILDLKRQETYHKNSGLSLPV